jgi:hypothetical protein
MARLDMLITDFRRVLDGLHRSADRAGNMRQRATTDRWVEQYTGMRRAAEILLDPAELTVVDDAIRDHIQKRRQEEAAEDAQRREQAPAKSSKR